MYQPKSTEKKTYRQPQLYESRKQANKADSFQFLENSFVSRQLQRNENAQTNINSQLQMNFNQIKQLLNQRKHMLKFKHETLISKNREKVQSIAHAREQDLKNQAKLLNDRSIIDLVQHAESLNKSKSLMLQISQIKNMSSYDASQRNMGKQFWDRQKEIEKQRKRKSQMYTTQSKKLIEINQKQRMIFSEIERCENQFFILCTRGRNQPDHIKRAQRLNEQIQKRKNSLYEIKTEKNKLKSSIINIIDEILNFNESNEKIFKNRLKQLDEIYAGSENLSEFDNLMSALQKIIFSKNANTNMKQQSGPPSMYNVGQFIKNYDSFIQQLDKIKQDQDMIFGFINIQLKENIKNAIMEKAFLSGVPIKQDQNQLVKKLRDYRKLLFDLNEDRPRLQQIINKINKMSSVLYPIKKAYTTEDIRREELKRQIKRLFSMNMEIQAKQKQFRNFQYDMEELLHKRTTVEAQINDFAQKVNLVQYKNKMRELELINKKIGEKNDAILHEQITRLKYQLEDQFNHLSDNYEDLINQVEVQDQRPHLGVFLTKLEKRLSLI